MEETVKLETFSEATSDDCEIDLHKLSDNDDGEDLFESSDIPKLQFRKDASKAQWINDLRMAVVVVIKGKLWTTTGIVRDGQIYYSAYETLYLVEIGALHVVDGDDMPLSLNDMYLKVVGVGSRFSWASFEAYKHLKVLGYIVGHYNVPWTMKSPKVDTYTSSYGVSEINGEGPNSRNNAFVGGAFEHLEIDDIMPLFDVYLPNSKFKKSSPGSPLFVLCRTSDHPPLNREVEKLERRCSGKPLKFFNVDHGRISWTRMKKILTKHINDAVKNCSTLYYASLPAKCSMKGPSEFNNNEQKELRGWSRGDESQCQRSNVNDCKAPKCGNVPSDGSGQNAFTSSEETETTLIIKHQEKVSNCEFLKENEEEPMKVLHAANCFPVYHFEKSFQGQCFKMLRLASLMGSLHMCFGIADLAGSYKL